MIEERLSQDNRQPGSGLDEKPVGWVAIDDGLDLRWESQENLIDWLLEDAPEERRTVHDIVLRILAVNFAAIHTTTAVCNRFRIRSIWIDVSLGHTGMHARLVWPRNTARISQSDARRSWNSDICSWMDLFCHEVLAQNRQLSERVTETAQPRIW